MVLSNQTHIEFLHSRRGKPCWFRQVNYLPIFNYLHFIQKDVGLAAINDAFLSLKSCIYLLLRRYFKGEKCYPEILDLFHETSFKTELGQLLDMNTEHTKLSDPASLDSFTPQRYRMY